MREVWRWVRGNLDVGKGSLDVGEGKYRYRKLGKH